MENCYSEASFYSYENIGIAFTTGLQRMRDTLARFSSVEINREGDFHHSFG